MKKIVHPGKVLILCLFCWAAAAAGPGPGPAAVGLTPAFMYGNWISTDGSNRFVLGISHQIACYRNTSWQILSAEEMPGAPAGHWQLHLQHENRTATLDLYRKDSSLLLAEGKEVRLLSSARTYNYLYHPPQKTFRPSLFSGGTVQLRGFIRPTHSRPIGYVQVCYDNALTGEKDYFFADIDSLGRFSLRLPVNRPQLCTLSLNRDPVANFMVQPGDTMLLAFNKDVELNDMNPDYDRLMQRVCFMGDEAAFNNQYQHFLQYAALMGYPSFEFPAAAAGSSSGTDKGPEPFAYFGDLYARAITAIDRVYPPSKAEQRFIDFIKAEIRYSCARGLLRSFRGYYGGRDASPDSIRVQKLYDQYLARESPAALLHDSYYRLAALYGSWLCSSRHDYRSFYNIPHDRMDQRVKDEYSSLLSGNFRSVYKEIEKGRTTMRGMKDDDIADKYFHGDMVAADSFRYLYEKINNGLIEEVRDSAAYRVYAGIPNPVLRFAAGMQQLLNNPFSDYDIKIASLNRLAIFRHYNAIPGMPFRQVDSVNKQQALLPGAANLALKGDDRRIRQVNHESEWQAILQGYKGKMVVVWIFSGYFEKELAARSFHELHAMEERYRGQNVVFLTCIQQRRQNDKAQQLVEYLKLLSQQGGMTDFFYVDRDISACTMILEAIDGHCMIYDETGRPHHPREYTRGGIAVDRSGYFLPAELDAVRAGRGRYYEEYTSFFLSTRRNGHILKFKGDVVKAWTLADSTENYFTYEAGEPEKPLFEHNFDSVFREVSLTTDSGWIEQTIVLHRRQKPGSDDRIYNSSGYGKEELGPPGNYTLRFSDPEKILRLYDRDRKLYRQFRLVFITADRMVLERLR